MRFIRDIIKIISIMIVLVSAVFIIGCSGEPKEEGQLLESAGVHEEKSLRDGNGTGARDGSGEGEFGKGAYGEGDKEDISEENHGYLDGEGNTYTAEELNAIDKSNIVIEESMTLDEISSVSMIKVWHFVADFNLPQGIDTSKTIAELNQEDDIDLDVDEIRDYIINFKHGLDHHPEE